MISFTPVMTSSGHTHGHMIDSKKNVKASKNITFFIGNFFLIYIILTLIFISLCIDFVSNVGFNRSSSKKAGLIEKMCFL